jgi:hypothetical protein
MGLSDRRQAFGRSAGRLIRLTDRRQAPGRSAGRLIRLTDRRQAPPRWNATTRQDGARLCLRYDYLHARELQ